jgi:hypothetical protein
MLQTMKMLQTRNSLFPYVFDALLEKGWWVRGFCEHFGYPVPLSKYDIHHKRLLLYYLIHDEALLGLPREHTLLSITPP